MTTVEDAIARAVTGARIRALREAAGIKQAHLAARVGCSQSHMANIERGHSRVTDDTRQAIAAALGVTIDDLAVA